jgi:hypothetical protein
MGHIINLTVQAFLFGDDEYDISPDPTALELAKWRRKGALGSFIISSFLYNVPHNVSPNS